MTNAMTERYFSYLDTVTEKSPRSTIASRASISTARYNNVYTYLSNLSVIEREGLIRNAFSNNKILIKNRQLTETQQKKILNDKIKDKATEVKILK